MIRKILNKRISMELEAWNAVDSLMPRGKATRGIQYLALEYLFERLYERVSEQDLADHLLQVKGHLQATGDPVKGAINQALKELQRIPDRPFEIVKIQASTAQGPRRFVQMNFTRFEDVIGHGIFSEYLQEVLHGEQHVVVRGIGYVSREDSHSMFPGSLLSDFENCRAHFLINPVALEVGEQIQLGFLPDSPASIQLLLVYEDEAQERPFLGFVARGGRRFREEGPEYMLYRGSEKLTKLAFLDRTWRDLAQVALPASEMEPLRRKAKALAQGMAPGEQDLSYALLNGLLIEAIA